MSEPVDTGVPQPDPAAATAVTPEATRRSIRGSTSGSTRAGGGAPATAPHNPTPRAGRNLYAAVGVGVFLGAVVLASLFIRKEAFVVVATVAAVVATWELLRAMAEGDIHPPVVPTFVGAAVIPPVAYAFGPEALASAVALTFVAILVWRSIGSTRDAARDIAGGFFTTLYVPSLVSFAILLVSPDDGPSRIVVFILTTICSDIGGYAVGVLFGKHPMAPTVSPKKSWEGFAGSVLTCMVVGAIALPLTFDGATWWQGALLGTVVAPVATIGDLVESSIKRDLGVKDMSNILPGHGGIMDRLDSLALVAPVVWAALRLISPVSG